MPQPVKEMILQILQKNPHLRPSIDTIISSPIFDIFKDNPSRSSLNNLVIKKPGITKEMVGDKNGS